MALTLKRTMAARPVIGTFLKLPRPEVVEILGLSGIDFVICDMEHGQVDEAASGTVIQAGRATGVSVIVRVAAHDAGLINRLLEAGAEGIQLSDVKSRGQTEALHSSMTYPPAGDRGLSMAQPAAGYGRMPLNEYMASSNDGVVRIAQFERADFDDSLETIMPPLDVAFIGVLDLSVSLGVPGKTDSPVVKEHIDRIVTAAHATDTTIGVFAATAADAEAAITAGFRYIAVGSDLALLSASAKTSFGPLRASHPSTP
jgi:2-keto-3-deoxy-L-rhamnonate aldolase RhmA